MTTPAITPGPALSIDGRGVWVFDGLLEDASAYVDALARAPFTRTEVARPDTAGYRHWVNEVSLDALQGQKIQALTIAALASALPGRRYRPYRAYTNVATFGDMLFTHVDCAPDQSEITALWYLCKEWDLEWGGETVFFDARDEIAFAVRPRPGRLVLFDGRIKHVGRPPNRISYAPRYTFAIKLEPVPA